MKKQPEPTFESMLNGIRHNPSDADWDYFDAHLGAFLGLEYVRWAKSARKDQNKNIRDAAATVLARSDYFLTQPDQNGILIQLEEGEEHEPVRHWLANALYRCNNRAKLVVGLVEEASRAQTPAGDFAQRLLQATKDKKQEEGQ